MAAKQNIRKRKRRRARPDRTLILIIGLLIVVLIGEVGCLLHRSGVSAPSPTAQPTALPTPQPTAEPSPTPEPTIEPTPTPAAIPSVVSFYRPKDKYNSPRVRISAFETRWKRGEDIGSFEAIASEADVLPGSYFADIFKEAWIAYPDFTRSRIGYALRYTLADGQEIAYTIRSPKDIQSTEYIECWLYDDVHQKKGKFYSHLLESSMKDTTLITSIKLTCGSRIQEVDQLWLTAFLYTSDADFDGQGNYIGGISCEIPIRRKG